MKVFGNRKRHTDKSGKKQTEVKETPVQEEQCSPQKAIFLFCGGLCLFIGAVVMCLLLIQRSGEQTGQPPETQVNELQYVVNELPTESTAETEPMPELEAPESVNDSDILNILLISPDSATLRTDTLMLLNIDLNSKDIAFLSIPRDTYISGNYDLPKLHQVFHEADGGERGAEAVKEKVKEMIGFWPDYYFILDQQTVSLLVEQAGGSMDFTLPAEPAYCELSAGKQTLTGASALKLLQYRDDYTEIETGSTEIQRDFVLALLEQLSEHTENVMESATEISAVAETDLSETDLAYLLNFLKESNFDTAYSASLPGKEIKADGEYFYQVDIEDAVELLNSYFNPLEEELSIYDVNFRQKTGDSGEGYYSDFGFPSTETTAPSEEETESTEPSSSEENADPSSGESTEPSSEPESSSQETTETPTEPPAESSDTP